MKLIIENIGKIHKKQLPQNLTSRGLWEIDNILTEDSTYHFIMQRWWGSKINYVCKLSIMREGQLDKIAPNSGWFYLIKIDGHKTIHYLNRDDVKDMNKVMNKFADILNRIPQQV
jgi:hypothetical protein